MIDGPDTKYMMQWGGKWRAVSNMFDASNMPTTLGLRAAKVVLYIGPDHWIATTVFTGEIIERTDRDPGARHWDMDV